MINRLINRVIDLYQTLDKQIKIAKRNTLILINIILKKNC
ncbi:hypothetical protein K661_01261 [Piscirickettsia salmonis LF-89 = ATCC VR-1361]|nr:hypothetical protein K661_01261 [Piscirickettsia salmonis LF-89 = ATCC VR-1361]